MDTVPLVLDVKVYGQIEFDVEYESPPLALDDIADQILSART